MQAEWCVIQRGADPLPAFVATLGFSRYSYVEFVRNERFVTLRACHENAFDYFRGVPKEVLYDNMRTVIQQRSTWKVLLTMLCAKGAAICHIVKAFSRRDNH